MSDASPPVPSPFGIARLAAGYRRRTLGVRGDDWSAGGRFSVARPLSIGASAIPHSILKGYVTCLE
jgi:hypothetical protein